MDETTIATIDLDDLLNGGNLPNPIRYQYYKKLKNNTIIINDEIDDTFLESAILPLMDLDNDPNVNHIDIILDSPGGLIYQGMAIIPILENLKTDTTLRIIGMAASMAGLIAMAKGPHLRVVCDRFAVGLIHSGSSYLEGSTTAVRDTFHFNEKYEKKLKDYILTHTKIDDAMYEKIERQEFWMDAEDMLKYGIVDEIIG